MLLALHATIRTYTSHLTTITALFLLFLTSTFPLTTTASPTRSPTSQFRLVNILHHGFPPTTDPHATRHSYFRKLDVHPTSILGQQRYTAHHITRDVYQWSDFQARKVGFLNEPTSPRRKPVKVPDHTDPETVLALGRMTHDAYLEPDDAAWIEIPGWNKTAEWLGEGISLRAYVFYNEEEEILAIVLKGTTLATPVGGGPSSSDDKFNDNIMFSCCCAKAGWSWKPICDCVESGRQCNRSCLIKNSNFDSSYYNLAQTFYLAVREWFPVRTTIWLAGHSLGGALASLVALTNDLPAFAYEAPGDLLFATRLGLLPSLPGDQDPSRSDYTDFLKTLPIYHFGNTGDPIFLGQCNGPLSSCWWFDYALETGCHIGSECVYDFNGPPSNPSPFQIQAANDQTVNPTQILSVRYHTIDFVIKNFLEAWPVVPSCNVTQDCLKGECRDWTYV